ncbi:MAG: RNA polymerase sigma factor [Solirubrobacteraceae bacterium]
MSRPQDIEDLLRKLAPQVLSALLRRHRSLDVCEDAVQEALLAAAATWTADDLPENPRGWLFTVATRRLIDDVRSERARRAREDQIAVGAPPSELLTLGPESAPVVDRDRDDTLTLLVLCCHPALSAPSQIALTLRAVGGLSTAEIAACFFVSEATMAQRISRAKQTIRDAGARFEMPPEPELGPRLAAVMHVLYLIFNEGYTTSSGARVNRVELTTEAIRLTRELRRLRPDDSEATGLLALMLLTDARRAARTTGAGELIDLAEQDRSRWDHARIEEGVALITVALAHGPLGAYQLQAAIAAVHDEADRPEDTDWAQILALHQILDRVAPNPMATLGRAVAAAMAIDPCAGLEIVDGLAEDRRIADHHRFHAVRGQLLEMAGEEQAARDAFRRAARLTTSVPEKRYLTARAAGEQRS